MTQWTTHDSTFDTASWRFDARRSVAVLVTVLVAVALFSMGSLWGRVVGAALLIELALVCLPWRVPRTGRSGWGFWAESLCALVGPVAAVVCWFLLTPDAAGRIGSLYWYPVAVIVGELIRRTGGPPLRATLDGRVSFILGPTPRSQSSARSVATVVGAVGEETLFRAPWVLLSPSVPLALLGLAGFVARHHTQPGMNGRGVARTTAVELLAGCVFLALTYLSGSLYPAVLAHLVNNVPQAIAEARRSTEDDDDFFT